MTIQGLAELHRQTGPAEARLEELERTRAHWEAEMEARILKADSTLKSAANAESRARSLKRSYEKLADPFDVDGEDHLPEERQEFPEGNVEAGETHGVLPLHVDLETNNKTRALRAKFF